jgi:S-DNA-T family DNA segregation ATPase FtsK/SpoIIIE
VEADVLALLRLVFYDLPRLIIGTLIRLWMAANGHRGRGCSAVAFLGLTVLFGPAGAIVTFILAALALAVVWLSVKVTIRFTDRRCWWFPWWLRGVAWLRSAWVRFRVYEQPWQRGWQATMKQCWLTNVVDDGLDAYPRLIGVRSSEFGDVLTVRILLGHTLETWERAAPTLATAFGAQAGSAYEAQDRKGQPRVGTIRLELAVKDALSTPIPALPIPASTAAIDFTAIPIGRTAAGAVWNICVLGSHLLIAGLTGSGKGSIMWSIIRGVLPAVRDGVVVLWGCDPKGGMELAFGEALFAPQRYCDRVGKEMVAMLGDAVRAMEEAQRDLRNTVRKLTPSVSRPLHMIVIDECAQVLSGGGDSALAKQAKASITRLVNEGRACGFFVLVALQDPRVEVIAMRDQFPEIVGLRMRAAQHINMLFGPGAMESGIAPHRIQKSQPGYAYAYDEEHNRIVKVRAAWVSDEDLRAMAAAYAPSEVVDGELVGELVPVDAGEVAEG